MSDQDGKPEAADGEFAQALQRAFRSSEDLDDVTTRKLRAARARAMDAAGRSSRPWLWISGGVTAAAMLLLMMNLPLFSLPRPASVPGPQAAVSPAEAQEVLADELDPEFYEDLEMVRWLNRAPAPADHEALPGA